MSHPSFVVKEQILGTETEVERKEGHLVGNLPRSHLGLAFGTDHGVILWAHSGKQGGGNSSNRNTKD
jgi:hypothetical protein